MIHKLNRLVDTALEAFEEMRTCYRLASAANEQALKTNKSTEQANLSADELHKAVAEGHRTAQRLTEAAIQTETLRAAREAQYLVDYSAEPEPK